jgi:N-acetylmuramoyl-L-alanine amidase
MIPALDSSLVDTFRPSPNHGERRAGARPDSVILHYTGMPTGGEALERLCDPAAEVSSHYLVWEDGRVFQLVAEERRAWHAGAARWRGADDLNSRSIGVEIVNPGHPGGCPPFPDRQIDAVAALCRDIAARHGVPPERVLAHSDIAPGRKIDPGEAFPWERLHGLGVGHWAHPARVDPAPPLAEGATGPAIAALRDALSAYGYDISAGDAFDARTRVVVEAFQRHFRRARVDGVADAETVAMLDALNASLHRS